MCSRSFSHGVIFLPGLFNRLRYRQNIYSVASLHPDSELQHHIGSVVTRGGILEENHCCVACREEKLRKSRKGTEMSRGSERVNQLHANFCPFPGWEMLRLSGENFRETGVSRHHGRKIDARSPETSLDHHSTMMLGV